MHAPPDRHASVLTSDTTQHARAELRVIRVYHHQGGFLRGGGILALRWSSHFGLLGHRHARRPIVNDVHTPDNDIDEHDAERGYII